MLLIFIKNKTIWFFVIFYKDDLKFDLRYLIILIFLKINFLQFFIIQNVGCMLSSLSQTTPPKTSRGKKKRPTPQVERITFTSTSVPHSMLPCEKRNFLFENEHSRTQHWMGYGGEGRTNENTQKNHCRKSKVFFVVFWYNIYIMIYWWYKKLYHI